MKTFIKILLNITGIILLISAVSQIMNNYNQENYFLMGICIVGAIGVMEIFGFSKHIERFRKFMESR